MSKQCKVVEDLLPLYHDGICSEESRQIVEEHLSQCEHCRKLLDQIDGELVSPATKDADIKPLEGISKAVKRGKKNALFAGISIAMVVVLVLFVGLSIRWYSQEYSYYAAFGEGRVPHSNYELNEDGSIKQSIVVDASKYTWYDDTYRYDVVVPGFLSRAGHVEMARLDNTENEHIDVGISRWNNTEYVFHVSIARNGDYYYFMVDSAMKQFYLDHWTDEMIQEQTAELAKHKEEVQTLINDAMAMWTFIK